MGTQGTGRKRSTKKERSTAEDDALNLIAREAEARLAAKRAARAEAREIRMKELERQQKELSDDDERMSVGSRGSVRVEDRDYLEKGSRAGSALTAATLTSLGGSSSRRGSGETALTVDAETSLREIKETLAEVEEKYRKAMVSNAQLDNEKNNLMYQVDTLKDSLMELEELLSESRREFEEKVKEYEREKHAHGVLQFQYNELKETLKQSEELLNKHGIVLGPDLNINGDIGEAETEGTPGGDSAPQPAQESQTSPTEGNSMLGSAEETLLRSRGKEEVDPEQRQEMFEEGQENHVTSDWLCNDADAVTVQTSGKEPPTEEQMTHVHREEVDGPSKDVHIDTNADDETDDSPELQENSTSPGESIIGAEERVGGDLVEPTNQDKQETRTKSRDDASSDDSRETFNNLLEQQGSRQQNIEESQLGNTEEEESKQQNTEESHLGNTERSVQDVEGVENKPDEANQEAENAEGDNDEAEESSCKPQPQGATASGKKKKKKKRGKKKGGSTEDKQKQKDVKEDNGTDQENGKTEEAIESTAKDGGSTYKPHADAAEGSKMGQVMKEPERRDTVEADAEEQAKPTKTISHAEAVKESDLDQSIPEQVTQEISSAEHGEPNEIALHSEALKESYLDEVINEEGQKIAVDVSAVETTETVCLVETTMESNVDQNKAEPVKQEEDAMGHLAPNQTFSNMETPKESHPDQVMNVQEQKNAGDVSAVDTTETFYHAKTTMESEVDQSIADLEKQEDAADCLEPDHTSSDMKALKESLMDEVINEEEQKNAVDATVVEEAQTLSQTTIKSEVDQSFAEPVKQENAGEDPLEPNETCSNTESLKESHLDQAINEEEHSKAVEVSVAVETMETSHKEPLQESELDLNEKDSADTLKKSAVEPSGTLSDFGKLEPKVDGVEDDHSDKPNLDSETAEVINVMAPTTFSTPETVTQSRIDPDVEEQDTEKAAESNDEGSRPDAEVDISAAEKVLIETSSDTKSTDNLDQESSENKNDTCASADGGSEKATMDSLDEVKPECMSDSPENIGEPTKNIEDTVDKPANDSAVIESPPDSLSEPSAADDPTPGDGSVRVPDETVDDHEGLGSETQESNPKSSSETELTDTIETVSSPVDSTSEILVTEQSCDGKGSVSAKDEESEQLNDPREDKTEDPSQLSQQDDEEDDEAIGDDDEEGQSFDFDDMDLDEAEETLNQNSGREDVEEGVEVTVDESCVGEKNQSTPSGTVTTEEDRSSADECNEADTPHISKVETDASPKTKGDTDETEGKVQKDAARENAGAASELGDEAKPEELPSFGEIVAAESSSGAENVQEAAPVEEAVEAVEMQGKDQAPSKSTDQVSGAKAAPAPSKDAKKNGKKSKGKDECKMT